MRLEETSIFIFFVIVVFLMMVISFSFAIPPPGGPVGSIGIIIHGTSSNNTTNTTQQCGNSLESCGKWPDCMNITGVSYCEAGKFVELYCYRNLIKTKKSTSLNCLEFGVKNSDGDDESAEIKVLKTGTSTSLASLTVDGHSNITSSYDQVDFEFLFDESNFKFKAKKLNFEKLSSKPANIIIDVTSPDIPNVAVHHAYKVELPADFSSDSIELTMKYDPDEVSNASALSFYKCASAAYNFDDATCNSTWTKIPSTIDTTSHIVTATITSFSTYVLGEQNSQSSTTTTTTTTRTTTTTTTSSASATTTTTTSSSSSQSSSSSSSSQSNDEDITTTTTQTATASSASAASAATTTTLPSEATTQNAASKVVTNAPTSNFVLTPEKTQLIIFFASIPAALISFLLIKKYDLYNPASLRYSRVYARRYGSAHKFSGSRGLKKSSKRLGKKHSSAKSQEIVLAL